MTAHYKSRNAARREFRRWHCADSGGTTSETEAPDIESLGRWATEPLWTFARSDLRELKLNDLRGRKVSLGRRAAVRGRLRSNCSTQGHRRSNAELFGYSPQNAREKLLSENSTQRSCCYPGSHPSPAASCDERVELLSFPDTDAYVASIRFSTKVVGPAGVGDLTKHGRPLRDIAGSEGQPGRCERTSIRRSSTCC